MSQELILLLGVTFTILLVLFVLADAILGRNRRMQARVKKLRQRLGEEMPDVALVDSVLRQDKSKAPTLDKMVRRLLPSAEMLNQRLARAGLESGPGSFIAGATCAGLIGAVVLYVFAHLSLVVCLLGGVGIGLGGAHLVIDVLISRRSSAFTKTFPDAIDLIVRAVKSGLPVTEGISLVANDMEGPVSAEFRRISENMKIGEGMDAALWDAAARLENAEFNFFVISLVVQSETGGNLAETLENLSDILRQRQTMKLKIRAMASEARASAYILGGLPFAMFAILEVLSPGYTSPLYQNDTGTMLSVGALISIALGAFVMFKMVRFEI